MCVCAYTVMGKTIGTLGKYDQRLWKLICIKCYESAWKRTCVYIILMHGEEESLSNQRLFKDHSWRIEENSWVLGSENLKNSTYITTCCLGGFQ